MNIITKDDRYMASKIYLCMHHEHYRENVFWVVSWGLLRSCRLWYAREASLLAWLYVSCRLGYCYWPVFG